LVVRIPFSLFFSPLGAYSKHDMSHFTDQQPYLASSPTSNWRPLTSDSSSDPQPFAPGSKFQFVDPDTPTEAVKLVRDRNLHFAFGDFDDHLEDVTIGEFGF